MKNRKTRFVLSVGTLAIAATSTPVSAQVEEIIVTAQRRDQSAQDVPISMQVVSGDDLQDRQISGTGDLADSLPNVMVTNDSVSNNIYVRGVGSGSNAGPLWTASITVVPATASRLLSMSSGSKCCAAPRRYFSAITRLAVPSVSPRKSRACPAGRDTHRAPMNSKPMKRP